MANFFNLQIMRRLALLSCSIFLLCMQLRAQNRVITGKILDEHGNPIPLVSVTIKGTSHGATSAEDGSFQISVNSSNTRLIFSSIGYLSQEIAPGSSDHI